MQLPLLGMLKFRGSQHFRHRLVCATLSGKPIRIEGIRERDQNPGLRDYEACLLRLIEKVTDGCVIEINETGAPHDAVVLEASPNTYKVFPCLSSVCQFIYVHWCNVKSGTPPTHCGALNHARLDDIVQEQAFDTSQAL